MQKCILVIDSKKENLDFLSANLTNEGYKVLTAENGTIALELIKQLPDLIILDIALPDMNGLDIIRQLKRTAATSPIPIIVLTSKGTEADEIISLEVGSDDFILKPVQIQRLLARIRTIFRRQNQFTSENDIENDVIELGDMLIFPNYYSINVGQDSIVLPKKEFEIFVHLVRNRGRVITRTAIFNAVWGNSGQPLNRTIDVHIGRIRERLKVYGHYIETVPGVGYRFRT